VVFSSHVFIFYFLPVVLLVYYLLLPFRWPRHFSLTLLSYVFYGWANPRFVVLMFFNTLIDYIAGLVQAHNGFRGWSKEPPLLEEGAPRSRTQKIALIASVCTNLSLLAFFKYFNFAYDNYAALASWLGVPGASFENAMRVTLPLGISFYTFQSMSYSIDVYRGHTRAMRSANDFFCYVAMFHQLVAGPIVRFSEVADQLKSRRHSIDKFARGVALFSLGLAMKVLLANPCGKIADTVFDAHSVSTLDAWYGTVAYSLQILFDFSGYSEMAIGLGLMMGFVFAKNFETPYQSQSITEFWRRWHISLSTWLRDYLYVPLGGNRKGPRRTYINLLLTMLLGGLWHGASWNFLLWGGLHGGALALERAGGRGSFLQRWPRLLRVAWTFGIVLIGWVFFRARDLPAAFAHLQSMVGLRDVPESAGLIAGIIYQPYYLICFAIAATVAWSFPTAWAWTQKLSGVKACTCMALLWLSLVMLATQEYNPFIYFIF
jgi:alginate O-acetyltransferase complex protein AlgI